MKRLVLFVLALVLLGTDAAALPPPEAFGDLPFASDPQLSPDGKHFAVIQPLQGRPVVAIYTVGTGAKPAPKLVQDDEDIITAIRWVNNDRLLLTLEYSVKRLGGIDVLFRSISVDAAGQHGVMMFSDSVWRHYNASTATVSGLDAGDPNSIYMPLEGLAYGLYRVDVTTGKAERIASLGFGKTERARWIMDGAGHLVGRLVSSPAGTEENLEVPDKNEWRVLRKFATSDGRDAGFAGVGEDGALLHFEQSGKHGTRVLAPMNPHTGEDGEAFYDGKYDLDDVLLDPWSGRVIGVSFLDDRSRYHYFDPKMQALQRGLEAAFPDQSVHAVSWDKAKSEVVVAVDGAQSPETYYLLDRTIHEITQIVSSYPDLTRADLGAKKPYPYAARDGTDIPAYLTLPPHKAGKNLPTVILPHGGPMARDSLDFDWMAAFLANRGYAVLQPNFRGSSGYSRKFLEAGFGRWGLEMQDDVTDGVRKLVADGISDPKKICIVGASYGGYAALAGAAFTPELYACAASFAGVSDLRKFLRTRRQEYGKYSWMSSAETRFIGDRAKDADALDATSPALHAEQIRCPVLLVHDVLDTTVPIEQSREMNDALVKAKKRVKLVELEGDSHYMQLSATRVRFLTELEGFLTANIGN